MLRALMPLLTSTPLPSQNGSMGEGTKAGATATYLSDLHSPVSPSGREAYKKHPRLSERYTHKVAAPVKLETQSGDMRHVSRLVVRQIFVIFPRLPHLTFQPSTAANVGH
jgi:hypothetical protein